VNILDENIPKSQRLLLETWNIKVRQIGFNFGQAGMADEEIIPLLLTLRRPTFFTRDEDFYKPYLRHAKYCLIYLDVEKNEASFFIRRVLRQPELKTQAKRMGTVIRVSGAGLQIWRLNASNLVHMNWK